jgi:ATP-dependent exoDNAse (exonuclease V) alpha subunit
MRVHWRAQELEPAWAITVHKAQGCEYPVVVLPLSMAHRPMLQRRLLYTALSRARLFVLILGPGEAIELAVRVAGLVGGFGVLGFGVLGYGFLRLGFWI